MTIKIILTKGEKFKAQRRRNKLTHKECAKKLGISIRTIMHWEDDVPSTPYTNISLNEGELYYALRERLRLPLKKVAKLVGISHPTLIKIEKGGGSQEIIKKFYKKYMQKHNIKIKGLSLS